MAQNQIPYSGTSTVEPTIDGSGAHYQDVPQANPNAFGAQIGEAEQSSGQQIDKLAQRFADIYNQSTARDAVTKTAQDMSDAEMRFHQLKGNDAVAGLKPFQDEIKQIAQNNSQGLSIVGSEIYKNDAANLVNNATFRAGAHVGEQAEKAQTDSLNASIATNVNQFAMNATNPTGVSYLQNIQNSALDMAHHMGVTDPAVADQMVSHNYGEAYAAAIRTNLQSNPTAAKSLWDQAQGSLTKPDGTTVPYLDAAHRAQIASEMGAAFRQQFNEQLQTARSYAMMGAPYDKDSLVAAAKNAGHTEDYINAEIGRLGSIQNQFGTANKQYEIHSSLENDRARAAAGLPVVGNYDPATIQSAFPREPAKAQEILNEANDLHVVAGFVGALPTKSLTEIDADLASHAPTASMSIADSIHQQESGGKSTAPANGVSVGGWQITPDTFKQYAKQGEDINNPKDNEAVGRRIIDDLSTKFSGDPARIATGYFSGPGNVAPPGSPTPWIRDSQDANGKSVSSYVSDVTSRMGGQDFGEKTKLYSTLQKAASNYVQELAEDPAGKLASYDPHLTQLLSDGLKDPTKLGDFINVNLARQQAIGLPEATQAALPVQVAQGITANIMQNPASAADTMNKLQQQTGQAWPQVYKSLIAQGGLPPFYQAVAQLGSDPSTARDATLLTQWMANAPKDKSAADIIGAKEEKTIKDNIQASPEMTNFTQSLAHSGASITQIDGILNSVHELAYAKTLYDRDPNAADDAVKAFTDRYQFMPQGGARVPAKQYDAVSQNAELLLNNIDKRGAVLPAAYATGRSGVVKPEDYWNSVKANPTWVTSPDETAIWLKDPWDRFVRDQDGKPVSVPFTMAAPVAQQQSQARLGQPMNGLDMQ